MSQILIADQKEEGLKALIGDLKASRVLLVTGKKSYSTSGAESFISRSLKGSTTFRFSDFEQNPKLDQAVEGVKMFNACQPDAIVAIGGGSAIDMAKLINCFASNPGNEPMELIQNPKKIQDPGLPLIAIPTTAGTGSEATHFAVVYSENKKFSLAHDYILPAAAVLNATFLKSQPKYLRACAGLDAFSQAIESYWSVGSTPESRTYAREAINILNKELINSLESPTDTTNNQVLKAAYLAGQAINISKTTAAHAVSYSFTSFYGIPHGHAVFLTLPKFFEYNEAVEPRDCNDPRGVEHIKAIFVELCNLFSVDSAMSGRVYLENFASELGIELNLSKLGIEADMGLIANNVNLERLGNNPRRISGTKLEALLKN